MNNKITFPELVDSIAELTNTSKRVSELFLKELFGVIKECLEQGETVKIKNLGTFKVTEIAARKSVNVNTGEEMEIPSHRRVAFTPDKSLAEAINMPFEGFETVVLDDDLSDDDLKDLAEIGDEIMPEGESQELENDQDDEPQPPVFKEPETNEDVEPENEPKDDEEDVSKEDVEESKDTQEDLEENPLSETQNVADESEKDVEIQSESDEKEKSDNADAEVETFDAEEADYEEDVKNEKRKSFIWGFLGGIATFIVIGCIAIAVCDSCFGDFVPYSTKQELATDTISPNIVPDTVAVQADTLNQTAKTVVENTPKVITDTVRVNYFLTKMSRKYYGRYEFWVYIYEENKDKISNPNKVAPGLVVVIPPAEKYGIDKDNPESVKKAKELAEKIK